MARGRCPKHKAIQHRLLNDHRGTAHQRGYTAVWQRASKAYLHDHPLCYYCRTRGLIVPATSVDHKTPHKGDDILFWDKANWASACGTCNSAKGDRTAEEFLASLK